MSEQTNETEQLSFDDRVADLKRDEDNRRLEEDKSAALAAQGLRPEDQDKPETD